MVRSPVLVRGVTEANLRVFRRASRAGGWSPRGIAALGNFDGLHLGHRELIRRAVRRSRALSARSLVVTFDPHPRELLEPGRFRPLLPLKRKIELLEALGVDATLVLAFGERLACQAPEAFARKVLAASLRVREVYVGIDFCFGKGRSGNVGILTRLGRELGFRVRPVPLLEVGGEKVSSSRIRRLLDLRLFAEAGALLGRSAP